VKVEQVKEYKLGLKVNLQKVKVEQVEEQKLGSKIDLQKVKVELVEEGSTRDIEVETVDQIYNERFQKFWIIIGSKNP
jgi:Tfp pilus assembly PilM family ATPase